MIPLSDETTRVQRTPLVTYLLILANVIVFFLATESDIDQYALMAGELLAGQNLLTVFTAMFLHGDFWHLLFNVWSLWIFGDNVEDDLGGFGFLALYLATGIAGSLAFALFSAPMDMAIGASGAISGVMGAYLILHPGNKIRTLVPLGIFITTLRISAPLFIGLWFLIQFAGFAAANADGIAYSAHVGGFLAGLVLGWLMKPRTPRVQYIPPGS